MIEIKDKTHNLTYYFTLDKILETVKRENVVIWQKGNGKNQYIPNCVYKELSNY